jgi:hypothetical protein
MTTQKPDQPVPVGGFLVAALFILIVIVGGVFALFWGLGATGLVR